MTLKSHILQYCKERPNEWVHKGVLGKLAVNVWGYENENMGRRCRELENAGLLEVRRINNQAEYKYKRLLDQIKKEEPKTYLPATQASFFPVTTKTNWTQ